MSYLHPPPEPSVPVVVQKDVGGLVADYRAATEMYRRQGREVRLHECRSACTLALSLPNVCVYPGSVLKFHSAYHRDTKQIDHGVSRELFSAYPPAVQQRLGGLTRAYRSLSGQELIALGVRDCTRPAGETMIARARQAPATRMAFAPAEVNPLASLVDGVRSLFAGGADHTSAPQQPRPVMVAALPRQGAAPLPPRRPADIGEPPTQLAALGERAFTRAGAPPLPPTRAGFSVAQGADAIAPLRLPRLIIGAQPILPQGFTAYAALR